MLTSIDVKFIFDSAHYFRVVQLRKYFPNSRCCLSSCLLAVLAMFLATCIISPSSYSWNEWNFLWIFLCVCVCVCCIINFYCILQEEYPIKLWEKKSPPFLFSQLKTTQPCSRVFSVNGALTCKEAALLTSSVD